jgi:hypothetical protein
MSAIADAAAALAEALKGVPDLRVYTDPGATVDPPAAIVGPPQLSWEGVCEDPTSARFLVWVVVPADDRAVERLWELVPLAAAALQTVTDATVTVALPGRWPGGGSDLPAYEITTEVAL